ncbi:MAG: M48 family metallopeptidase [Spartobacteria bacterium]
MTKALFCALVFLSILPNAIFAQPPVAVSPPPAAVISADNPKAFDPAAATKAWLDTVPADKRARSNAYFEGGYWLILWDFLMAVAISLFLLASGLSARLRDFAERTSSIRPLQVAIYAVAFILITSLLGFPLLVYEQFFREHAYGLATQTFPQWFREQLIGLAINLIILPALLIGLYRAFRKAPKTWWLWASGGATLFLPILFLLSPVFIEPLFNKYTPLTDTKISEPILAMARGNEIPVTRVFEVDASRQTTRVSANVAGFLGTTRIALNDNLLKQCTLPEIREVMAHEMGHYVLNHTGKLIVDLAVFIFIIFAVARLTFNAAVKRWGARWDVRGIADLAGLPLLVLISATVLFVMTPMTNTFIRSSEREADAFGLNTSREADGMALVALKLGSYRKLDPSPFEEAIFYDHPSGRTRIRMAMDWKAAQLPAGDGSLAKSSPQR